jgi:plastocyanin
MHSTSRTKGLARRVMGVLGVTAMAASAVAGSLQVTVLDKNGKPLLDAVVIVVPEGKGVAKNPPPLSALVNQEKMQFVPAVTVVSPGAKIRFANNDPWDHQVRVSAPGLALPSRSSTPGAAPSPNDGFSLRLEGKTEGKPAKTTEVTMDQPGATGTSILGCFIHGSMSGHIYVAESPWTVKTGPDGVVMLDDVPDGAVSIKVWHALQFVQPEAQALAVGATPAKLTLQLDVVPRRRRS